MQTNLLPYFGAFRKVFITALIRFANELYTLYNQLNAISRFRKTNMKTCESVKRNSEL